MSSVLIGLQTAQLLLPNLDVQWFWQWPVLLTVNLGTSVAARAGMQGKFVESGRTGGGVDGLGKNF